MTHAAKTTLQTQPTGIARWSAHALTLFIAAVFLDSLQFKFTDAPKTQIIFGDLNSWAASLGAPGLFAHGGVFSQYVIGSAELLASAILIATMLVKPYRFLQPAGALLAIAIMSGAISFHLFTPLGVNVDNDGGSLFFTACGVWIGSWALLFLRRHELGQFLKRLGAFFAPAAR
ncbi:MAG: hypothetical protein AAB227_00665 [Pseudomonadota bacterium]